MFSRNLYSAKTLSRKKTGEVSPNSFIFALGNASRHKTKAGVFSKILFTNADLFLIGLWESSLTKLKIHRVCRQQFAAILSRPPYVQQDQIFYTTLWVAMTMGLFLDTLYCGLRMRRECRERFPCCRGLVIPACITARVWHTCCDACQDR